MIRTNAGLIAIAVAALVAGCSDNGASGVSRTTTQIAAQEIKQNTRDSAAPIELNDLPISDADTTETGRPEPI